MFREDQTKTGEKENFVELPTGTPLSVRPFVWHGVTVVVKPEKVVGTKPIRYKSKTYK